MQVSPTVRPPCNDYFKCWAYHKSGKVIVACGGDPGWNNGSFTHWMPTSLRHTAFCAWTWSEDDKPGPPMLVVPTITTIETKVIP